MSDDDIYDFVRRDFTQQTIKDGRARFSDGGPRIVVKSRYDTVLFTIEHGGLNEHGAGRGFTIESLHDLGTDFEHDSAAIFYGEGYGLTYDSMYGNVVNFTGVLMETHYYDSNFVIEDGAETPWDSDNDVISMCTDKNHDPDEVPHLIMPCLPPEQKFVPMPVKIELIFSDK